MDKTDSISIDDLCRFCLSKRTNSSLFIKYDNSHVERFKLLTNYDLPFNDSYPQYACQDCCEKMDDFYEYQRQLITKQEELSIILHNCTIVEYIDNETQSDIIEEEYLEESDNVELIEIESNSSNSQFNTIEMPSVKNLKQPNPTDIVKLIEEIERKNELIYENSKPTVAIRKRSASKKLKTSNEKVQGIDEHVNFLCSFCNKHFPSETTLRRHINQIHPLLTPPMKCCETLFAYGDEYNEHLMTNCSSKNSVNYCEKCDKKFKNKNTYEIHLKSHLIDEN